MAEKDTYSYKGWLVSDRFMKRVTAVWSYALLGTIMAYTLLFCIGLLINAYTGVWD